MRKYHRRFQINERQRRHLNTPLTFRSRETITKSVKKENFKQTKKKRRRKEHDQTPRGLTATGAAAFSAPVGVGEDELLSCAREAEWQQNIHMSINSGKFI